jgi:hypothetical protein
MRLSILGMPASALEFHRDSNLLEEAGDLPEREYLLVGCPACKALIVRCSARCDVGAYKYFVLQRFKYSSYNRTK